MLAFSSETLQLLFRPEIIGVIAVFTFLSIAAIAGTWRKVETHKADVELKRDMVARGMSAEEIERVLAARTPNRK